MTTLNPTEKAMLHGLFWLVIANTAGLVCGALLLFPALNQMLAPMTFGRWVPVHFNLQLYGWVSLPLIGMLFHFFSIGRAIQGRIALWSWSGVLALGALSWLAGSSSGKIFLEWVGPLRILFPAAMTVLWLVLFWGWVNNRTSQKRPWLGLLVLAVLLPVPLGMYLATGPAVYPAVNPNSGGATGSSLVGSTLAVVFLFLLIPLLGGRPRTQGVLPLFLTLFLVHFSVFALFASGNHSNHEPGQVALLGSLALWVPLLVYYWRQFHLPATAKHWITGFALWAALLCLSGWVSFLPGILDRFKFTNVLVGHAHLAMAGMVSSFLMILILMLAPRFTFLARTRSIWFWQFGTAAHVVILTLAGMLEQQPDVWFALRDLCYGFRLLAGLVMWWVSLQWYLAALKTSHSPVVQAREKPAPLQETGLLNWKVV